MADNDSLADFPVSTPVPTQPPSLYDRDHDPAEYVTRQLEQKRGGPENVLTAEGEEYARRLIHERNFQKAKLADAANSARQQIADYRDATNGAKSIHEAAFSDAPDSIDTADFDSAGLAEAIGLDAAAFEQMSFADAESAINEARGAVSVLMDAVDDTELLEVVEADPRKFQVMQAIVSREIDKLSDPYFGITGQRTDAQNHLVEAATLNVVKLQMAHGRFGGAEVPLAALIQRARLVMDKDYAPARRGTKREIVEPQNSFRSIHSALQANPW